MKKLRRVNKDWIVKKESAKEHSLNFDTIFYDSKLVNAFHCYCPLDKTEKILNVEDNKSGPFFARLTSFLILHIASAYQTIWEKH